MLVFYSSLIARAAVNPHMNTTVPYLGGQTFSMPRN